MKIEVKKWSMVCPAKHTPKHTLWMSNLDLVVPRIHVPTVYLYKPNAFCSNFFDASRLKEALSDALVQFYPVAGRLGLDANGRIQINCNGEGVLFQEAEAEAIIDDLGDFTPSHRLRHLIPVVDHAAHISSYPLLLLQVTYFKCGGVCLGVAIHHMVADGSGCIHFINSWSDITRGIPIAISPFFDRTILRARDPPAPRFSHVEYLPPPPLHGSSTPKPTSTLILHLTPEHLNALKAKSVRHGSPSPSSVKYSTYETLAAHLWRCICKARGLSHDQPTKLYIPTDGRLRLRPTLPPGYFGNALFTSTLTANSGDLQSEAFSDTVQRIRNAIAGMEDEYLRSAVDYLEMQPNLTALVRGAHTFRSPNLVVGSWTRLPIHDANFGWGRPMHMGLGSGVFEGNVCIQRSPTKDNHLSVVICLEAQPMQLFKDLLYDI